MEVYLKKVADDVKTPSAITTEWSLVDIDALTGWDRMFLFDKLSRYLVLASSDGVKPCQNMKCEVLNYLR